jgi:hypothetical protein
MGTPPEKHCAHCHTILHAPTALYKSGEKLFSTAHNTQKMEDRNTKKTKARRAEKKIEGDNEMPKRENKYIC